MPALEDGFDPSTSLGYAQGQTLQALPAQSALGGDDDVAEDFGGGGDLALPASSSVMADLRARTSRQYPEGSQRAKLQQEILAAESRQQAVATARPSFGSIGQDPAALERMRVPDAPELQLVGAEEEKPPTPPGIVGEVGRGIQRGAVSALHQLEGVANAVEQKLADWTGSEWMAATVKSDKAALAKRMEEAAKEYGATVPSVVAAFNDPSNAPRYIAGKVGEMVPMLAGYVLAGVPRMVVFGAMEGANRAAEENEGDLAAVATGAAVGAAVAGAPAPFLHGAAGKSFTNNVARATVGMPLLNVAGELAQPLPKAAATGQYTPPTGEQLAEAAATGVIAGPAVGAIGYAASRRRAATPGIADDQAAALDATQPTQGELPLTGGRGERPPPVTPTGQMELPLPSGTGERPPVQGEQMELPGIRPGRQPLGDIVPPVPRGPEPVQGELDLAGRPPEATAAVPPPVGPEPMPPPPPPSPSGGGPVRPTPVGGPQLELPIAETQLNIPRNEPPVPRPGAEPPIPGLGEPQLGARPPGAQPELPGTVEPTPAAPRPFQPGEAALRPIGTVEQPAAPEPSTRGPTATPPGPRTPEGWTVEPDHGGVGHVVKAADGHVISVGDTPQQAVEFARARSAEATRRPENIEPVKEAPPAAAEAKPAAEVGRDAVPETPSGETPTKAEEVKAKGAARRAEKAKPEQTETETTVTSAESDRTKNSPSPTTRSSGGGIPGSSLAGPLRTAERAAAKPAEQMTATELRGALRELGLGPSYTRTMKVAELRDLYRQETTGPRTKAGAYATPGEAADVTTQPAQSTRSTSTPMSRGARVEIEDKAGIRTGVARDVPQPRPGSERPVGTNVSERIAPALMSEVVAGRMSVARAHREYGVQKDVGEAGRGPGAPRQHRDLGDYLRAALETVEKPSTEADLQTALRSIAEQTGQDLRSSKVRNELRQRVAQLLKQEDAVRANRARYEAALREFEELRRAEESGVPPPMPEARVLGDTTGQAMAYRATRPEVNEPILRRLEGEGGKLHGFLDDVINSGPTRLFVPQHIALASVLKRILPNLEVVNKDLGDGVYGRYDPASGTLELNAKAIRKRPSSSALTTLLHEGLHGATVDYVHRVFNTPEINLSSREVAHKTALRAISDEITQVLNDRNISMTDAERRSVGYATREYVGGAPHEIITQVFTEPGVARVLSQTKASPQLKAMLDSAGLGSRGVSSLWDAFKRTVRQIFGLPGNDSILDHVFRPLADITEMGGHYRAELMKARAESIKANRDVLEVRPELRDELSLKNLREVGRTAAGDKLDTVWRVGLRGAMQGATTSAIHDFIRHLTPSVTAHRRALQNVTRTSETERMREITTHGPNGEARKEASIDKAMRLRKELTEGPDARAVNILMTDATQAGMSVIEPSRNGHVRTQDQIDIQRALQDRFDALDPAARQTYREVNEYHNELYRAEREAAVKDFVERSFPDLKAAEHDVIREQMRTRQGVEDVLARADATPVARMMGERWKTKSDLVKLIAESQKAGFVDGDYFPLRRHGEYIVSAGEHGKSNYIVQMFETASAARLFRDDLLTKRSDVSQVFVKSKALPRDLVPQQALSTLDRAMDRAGLTGTARDVLRDMYAGQLIQQGTRAATRTMKREGIAGASTDQARNLLVDFLAHTARIGHLTHGGEAVRTLYQVDREVLGLRGPNRGPASAPASARDVAIAQTGAEELRRRMAPADGDVSADWTGRGTRGLTSLTVLNTLLRPAYYVMNLAGTHIAATSLIAARHNLAAAGAVTSAFAELSGTAAGAAGRNAMAAWNREFKAANWILSDLYRARLKRPGSDIAAAHVDLLIDRLNQANLIDHTKMRELQRMAGPQGFGAKILGQELGFISRFLDVAGAGDHALDSMMRVGTAKAAFVLELKKNGGKDVNGALDYAMQMARDSQPDYNFHNKSRLATVQGAAGRFAPLVTQFKQFGLHMYGVQGNLLAAGIRNAAGSVERREAYKALALLQASHAVLYGGVAASVFGSLPVMFGLGLYDWVSGGDRPSTASMWEAQSRNWVRDMTGSKTVADMFARGVPMAAGLDVHRSLQFTNLLGVPELRSFDKTGMMELAVQVITGASGDTAAGMVESAGKIIGGDMRRETIAKMMPRIVRDPAEAWVWSDRGVTTPRGDLTILPADRFSAGAAITKGLGFIPSSVSDARAGRSVIQLAEQVSEHTHGKILKRLVQAAPADRKGVIEEIKRFNTENPADPITGQMIQQRLREQARINAQPNLYGVRGVAKRDVASRTELVRFANP